MNKELFEALEALCGMWNQYCPMPYGHMFMVAGENASDVLDKYGLLKNDNGAGGEVNYEKLEELRKTVIEPQSPINEKLHLPPKDETKQGDMFLNMQYYMEYCQKNGYVTPQDWIKNHKHF